MCILENVTCNPAYSADIFEIDKLTFGQNAWSFELINKELSSKNNIYIICKKKEETVIGFLSASIVFDEADITKIAVKEKYRCSGYGSKIMDFFIKTIKSQNFKTATLEVRSSNYSAIKLYEKFGFEPCFIRKNYYSNPLEDAVLMSLKL